MTDAPVPPEPPAAEAPGPARRVLVTRALPADWLEPLAAAGLELVTSEQDEAPGGERLRSRARGCSALLVMLGDPVGAALLDAAGPTLRVVATMSVGVDHIDLEACRARGVAVANTPEVLTDATADLAMALLLAVARRLAEGEALLRSGAWSGWGPQQLLGRDLSDARVLIVGPGRIGRAFARRVLAFGAQVAYHGPRRHRDLEAELGIRYEPELDAALGRAEVLSLHAPLTEATRHLLDARRLRLLPRGALLVNTARGPLVDEAALVEALRDGHLGGAGLDVFEREPAVHPALLTLPNVVLLPHLGSATVGTRRAMAALATGAILAVLRGVAPENLVPPARGR
jgi:glyoxylate reductase